MKYFYYILILFCITTNAVFPQISSQKIDDEGVGYDQQYHNSQLNSHQNTFSDFAKMQLGIRDIFAEKKEEKKHFDSYFSIKTLLVSLYEPESLGKSLTKFCIYDVGTPLYILFHQLLL